MNLVKRKRVWRDDPNHVENSRQSKKYPRRPCRLVVPVPFRGCLFVAVLVAMVSNSDRYNPDYIAGTDSTDISNAGIPIAVANTAAPNTTRVRRPDTLSVNSATTAGQSADASAKDSDDCDCPFRNSSLYRKVYIYPNYNSDAWFSQASTILSESGRLGTSPEWPWLRHDNESRQKGTLHYDPTGNFAQYTTELLMRDLLTKSCLATDDPDQASLFYVPYLPSVERYRGNPNVFKGSQTTSPFAQAVLDILEPTLVNQSSNYTGWETTWGLTSEYWKRRNGADHILVFSEPLHGLFHPKGKRGNFHYIHTQQQLSPAIVISIEQSRTFVQMYPRCATKNILVPYPNPDGRWYNGVLEAEVRDLIKTTQQSNPPHHQYPAALPAERELMVARARIHGAIDSDLWTSPRPASQFYRAGRHGTCADLRDALTHNFEICTESSQLLAPQQYNGHSMRMATFCPCPGGDSPSAKRMFDAVLAGCIPVVLSEDYIWPFSKESLGEGLAYKNGDGDGLIDPSEFSIRLQADMYENKLDPTTCKPRQDNNSTTSSSGRRNAISIQDTLETMVSADNIRRLRRGMVEKARDLYSWYRWREDLPNNPLREGDVVPDGGTARAIVRALEERAEGLFWSACRDELFEQQRRQQQKVAIRNWDKVRSFKC